MKIKSLTIYCSHSNNLDQEYYDLAKEIADPSNLEHVAAPIPGLLVDVAVTEGIKVQKGAKLCTIEAMKMETVIYADQSGTVERLCVKAGENIEAQQLLFVIK